MGPDVTSYSHGHRWPLSDGLSHPAPCMEIHDRFKACVFLKQKDKTSKREVAQVIQPFRLSLLQFPQYFASRITSNLLCERAQPHRQLK